MIDFECDSVTESATQALLSSTPDLRALRLVECYPHEGVLVRAEDCAVPGLESLNGSQAHPRSAVGEAANYSLNAAVRLHRLWCQLAQGAAGGRSRGPKRVSGGTGDGTGKVGEYGGVNFT